MSNDTSKALSTGQAARYCYVTSYTIANWIKSGRLKAQKTMGGQYRILVGDLRQFMIANNMRTDLLDEEHQTRPYCWEFHCNRDDRAKGDAPPRCAQCIVKLSGALNCYALKQVMAKDDPSNIPNCLNCEYYKAWGLAEKEEPETEDTATDSLNRN